MPSLTIARRAAPGLTVPRQAQVVQLTFPDLLSPIWTDYSVPQRRPNHSTMPIIGPQNMTSATKSTEILAIIRAKLSTNDVVDVRPIQH